MTPTQSDPFRITLESERVKLVPFEISSHLQPLLDAPPELYEYILMGPWSSESQFRSELWDRFFVPPTDSSLFAIYDKTKNIPDGEIAGVIGFLHTSFPQLSTEIAWITILPAFQRTHVTSNAMGLAMQYALNLPSDPRLPGLGLRRVAWKAASVNEKSVKAAQGMGFRVEGVTRWGWVLKESDAKQWNGKASREGDPNGQSLGRDSVMLSVCWDDWEGGVKELVQTKMDRRS